MEKEALIDRILGVEQDIAQSLFEVQLRSDQDIAKTLSSGNVQFKERCNDCLLQYSKKLTQAKEAIHQDYLNKIQSYNDQLRSVKTNKEALTTLLDKLLFLQ